MKFWSPDTRLAKAPVDPERSLGSLLLVKSYDTEHQGSQKGLFSGLLWRIYWSEKGVRQGFYLPDTGLPAILTSD